MARYKRRGASYFHANQRLPPTQERVHRLIGLLDEAVPIGAEWPDRGLGRSPIPSYPVQRPRIFYPPGFGRPLPSRLSAKPPFTPVWNVVRSHRALAVKALKSLSIRTPARARFCVQRKQRRETLFALRRVGFRGSSPGPYRRSQNSQYRC